MTPARGPRAQTAGRFKENGSYVIEASTNLVDWVLLGPGTNDSGKVEFTDNAAPQFTLRFYRVARVR